MRSIYEPSYNIFFLLDASLLKSEKISDESATKVQITNVGITVNSGQREYYSLICSQEKYEECFYCHFKNIASQALAQKLALKIDQINSLEVRVDWEVTELTTKNNEVVKFAQIIPVVVQLPLRGGKNHFLQLQSNLAQNTEILWATLKQTDLND